MGLQSWSHLGLRDPGPSLVDYRYDQAVNLEIRVIQRGHRGFYQQKVGGLIISEMSPWKKESDTSSEKGPVTAKGG